MPRDDLSFLDQLEDWLEQQVPTNLHELPYRMLETMERISNELFETLSMHGPPSISIPFPPFGKEVPAVPPPPPPPPPSLFTRTYDRADKLVRAHPYAVGAGVSLTLTVGLGLGGLAYRRAKSGYSSTRGRVEDGMLKEAIVILAPSPTPPMLWPVTVSLLRAGYVVLVAVPKVEEAEMLEKRLTGLEERSALRVLIYDPEDVSRARQSSGACADPGKSTTFPPFHRSLMATLTLRFPAASSYSKDPYIPSPSQVPSIHAFVSLYPLHPSPPSQPSALPALPTLLTPANGTGAVPRLITLYPSSSTLVTPDSFASQVNTANHRLLGHNLAVSCHARIISVFVGQVELPNVQNMILSAGPQLSRRQQAKEELRRSATASQKASLIKDHIIGGAMEVYRRIAGRLGWGSYGRDYAAFERQFLRIVKAPRYAPDQYTLGQYSLLSVILSRFPLFALPKMLNILPTLPSATGPTIAGLAGPGAPASRKPLKRPAGGNTSFMADGSSSSGYSTRGDQAFQQTSGPQFSGVPSTSTSASSGSGSGSEHDEVDAAEDLSASMHTTGSGSGMSSRGMESDSGNGSGLEGSWVGLDSAN